MSDTTMFDDEIRDSPLIIERMIETVSENHPVASVHGADVARRKLREIPWLQLRTLLFKWVWGDKDSIFFSVERDLFPA